MKAKLPKTAKEVRDFIGSNFGSIYCPNGTESEPSDDDVYTVSAHDLISSFAELDDGLGGGWQPIETAPTSGESVLLYYGPKFYIMEGRCFPRDTGYNGGMSYKWIAAVDMLDCEPTHWMPLPEPPADTHEIEA